MKTLTQFINEGLFSRKKKTNPLNLPDKMPKKYIECIEEYFSDIMDDVKTKQDVEDYFKHECDEFWGMVSDEYWDPEKVDFNDYRELVYNMWKDQVIKIVLK